MGVTLDLSRAAGSAAPIRPNLSGLTRPQLAAALVEAGVVKPEEAKMRASQLWRWIHHYGVTDFAAMTDVAKETRASLAEAFTLARLARPQEQAEPAAAPRAGLQNLFARLLGRQAS